jgi:Flp pilus assembly protein TadG
MTKPRSILAAFARAREGLAALEFALIAPMMAVLLLGTAELINALNANTRAQNAAASLADVVARDNLVTDDEIAGLWSAVTVLMYPDNGADLKVRITSVSIDDNADARVVWSEAHNGMAPLSKDAPIALPTNMLTAGTSVIVAETIFRYHPPLRFLFDGDFNITHTAYRRSRLVDPIPRASS